VVKEHVDAEVTPRSCTWMHLLSLKRMG
jgi:hypothetical protein